MQTNELIDAIRVLLDGRTSGEAPEVLALDYAKCCREVNERLGKIAMMLEGGGEIQALQLAEQPPRVVDTALALSFGGESAWQEFCLNHGHEVAPLVDAKTLESLLAIQSKGLAPNHPLYKDYRAAVSSRDDKKAHDLIRVIARMNPGDKNAAKELKRHQRKAFQAALAELKDNLTAGDNDLLAAMSRVEDTGLPEDFEKLAEWKQASTRRRGIRRDAAWKRMAVVLDLAEAELNGDGWRQAAAFHSEYTSLYGAYGQPESGSSFEERVHNLETALEQHRAEAEKLAKARHLVGEMERIADDVETRMVTPLGITPDFAAPLADDLTRKIRQIDSIRGEFPENSRRRIETARAQLNQALERSNRSKRIRLIVGLSAAALFILSAAGLGALLFRASSQADLLVTLREEESTSGLRELVSSIKNDEPILLKYSRLSAEVAQSSDWLESMDANLALVDQELTSLESARSQEFKNISSPDLFKRLEEVGAMVAELPADLGSEVSARLTVLRNEGERVLAAKQVTNDKLAREVVLKWNGILEGIDLGGSADMVSSLLEPAYGELSPFSDLAAAGHPLLRLPASTEALVKDTESRLGEMLALVTAVSDGLAQIERAESAEAYRKAIDSLVPCSFSEAAAAQRIADAWPDEDRVKAMLVFRGDLVALKAAAIDKGIDAPRPEVASESDRNIIVELTSSETLNELWDVVWKNSDGVTEKWLSKGELEGDATNGWTGEMAEYPKLAALPPKFKNLSILPSKGNHLISNSPTATTTMMSNLGLDVLLDNSGTKFKKSVLPLLDAVANDDKANPLAKVYVYKRLLRMIENHKPEEWGLFYCPTLIDDIKAFKELEMEMEAPVMERHWLLQGKTETEKLWEDYYAARGKRFTFREYSEARSAASEVIRKQVRLAGYLAMDETISLPPSPGKQLILGVCESEKGIHELKVCGIVEGEDTGTITSSGLLPLSPLLTIELSEKTQSYLLSTHVKEEADPSETQKP